MNEISTDLPLKSCVDRGGGNRRGASERWTKEWLGPHHSARSIVLTVVVVLALVQSPLARSATKPDAPGATPAQPALPVLTNLSAVRQLSPLEAGRGYPVRARGVVTYCDRDGTLFVQDTTAGIWVDHGNIQLDVQHGQQLELKGVSGRGEFAPIFKASGVRVLGKGSEPASQFLRLDDLLTGNYDSQWVQFEGVVRSMANDNGHLVLSVGSRQGSLKALFADYPRNAESLDLVDAHVRVRGVCASEFNQRRQLIYIHLMVPDLACLEIGQSGALDPFALPVRGIADLFRFQDQNDTDHLIHLEGAVTLYEPGKRLVIQNDSDGLLVESDQEDPLLQPGDRIDVVGFPAGGGYAPHLDLGRYRKRGEGLVPKPLPVSASQILSYHSLGPVLDARLVQLQARLVRRTVSSDEQILLVEADNQSFKAMLSLPDAPEPRAQCLRSLASVRTGSLLELTGVCLQQLDHDHVLRSFELHLGAPADVRVLEAASWWTLRHWLSVVGTMAFTILVALTWITSLRSQLRSKTEELQRQLQRESTFAKLGAGLNAATTAAEAGELVIGAARELFGWDKAVLCQCSAECPDLRPILAKSAADGRIENVALDSPAALLDPALEKALEKGAQLLACERLRTGSGERKASLGNGNGSSASMMLVPILQRTQRLGMLWIQTTRSSGYTKLDLPILQRLAERCGSTLGRIQAQETMRESEERYRQLVEGSPDMIFISCEGKITYMNPAGVRLLGASRSDQVVAKPVMNFIHPEYRELVAARIATGEPCPQIEEKYLRLDGSEVDVEVTAMRMVINDKPASQVIVRDITERKRTEAELLFKTSLLEAESETTLDGLLVVDSRGKVILANQRFQELWRMPSDLLETQNDETMLTHSLGQVKAPEAFLERVQQLYATPQEKSRDDIEFKDGTVLDRYSSPLTVRSGETVGRIWYFRDVTDSRRTVAKVRLQATALEATANAIVITDGHGTIEWVNSAFTKLTGYTERDVVGQNPRLLKSGKNHQSFYQNLWQTITSGQVWHGELINRRKDGSLYTEEMTITPLRCADGTTTHYIGIKQDVSERKEVEAKMAAIHRELVEISRQAGMAEVASNVLHNVGNVLNGVNVSSSLALEKVRTSKVQSLAKVARLIQEHLPDLSAFLADDPKGKQLPNYLSTLAAHLLHERDEILHELKSLSYQIEHIKEIVAMQQAYAGVAGVVDSLSLKDLVEDALRINEAGMERHAVHVVREYGDLPPIVSEKHKILQILINLIRNAKYALDDGNPPERRLILRTEQTLQGTVKVLVIDNGIGIPAENLTRIFAHGFTTRKGGHGFGLHHGALAAKELGGALRADSLGPGQGATFILELPCQRRERSQ